jgi:O-antigen/teichoic acid export membrane protein
MSAARPLEPPGAVAGEALDTLVRSELQELRLSHLLLYSVFGQIVYVLAQMAVLAVLARLRGAEAVGQFGLALAITTPVFMLVSMGGKSSQSSDVTQRYSYAEYGGMIIIAAGLAALVSVLVGLVMARHSETFLIVAIIAATKVAESISNLAYGAFQQAGRPDKIAWSLVLRGAFTVPIFAALLWTGVPVGFAFVAQLCVWSLIALLRDYPTASRLAAGHVVPPSFDFRRLLVLARETSPLGFSYLLNSLVVSIPRLFVERALGLSAVGLLTVVNYFQQAGNLLANAVSQMLVNRFARLRHAGGQRELRQNTLLILTLAAACSIAGIMLVYFAGEWILRTLFGPGFGAAHGLLMLIALAVSAKLLSMVPQSLLHADRRYKFFLIRELATVVVCVALLVLLVAPFGLMGAGYAILGATVFRLAIMTAAVVSFRRPIASTETASEFHAAGAP